MAATHEDLTATAGAAVSCPRPGHADRKVRRRGLRTTQGGVKQRYECVGDDGEKTHFFLLPVEDGTKPKKPQPGKVLRCPHPGHADSRLQSRGTRDNSVGTWQRYRCIRPNGEQHQFQVMVSATGTALTSLHRPPACETHPGSAVHRHGNYGKTKRQRYRCIPKDDAAAAHTFTPPLSREVVAYGEDACATCDELLSPHSGVLTGARHTRWNLHLFARALNELSMGASYSSTSLMMRDYRDRVQRHLAEAHGADFTLDEGATGKGSSYYAEKGKSAWHLAADIVEQYSPLLWRETEQKMRTNEREQRERNDEALAANPEKPLAMPVTWLLDEQPVIVRTRREVGGRRTRTEWSVLVVVEVRWHKPTKEDEHPSREYRLRLLRAYPRRNEQAWRLVFDELDVRPDFVIADHASAIKNALDSHYGVGAVGFVPSLFHMRRNIRAKLLELPGATYKVEGRRVLVETLAKRLDVLSRDDLLNLTPTDWSAWWDGLVDTVRNLGAPVVGLHEQRRLYEPRVVEAMPLLLAHPHLPASNAAVENRIRHLLEPFLENRKQLYRNLARVNCLLDLAVVRSQGEFTDLDKVSRLIRDDNEKAGGWAPVPRAVTDAQPPPRPGAAKQHYASLFNPLLIGALADERLGPPAVETAQSAGSTP